MSNPMNTYWERKANFRTYELSPELIKQIDALSLQMDVYQSELVRCLLSDALKRYHEGSLRLTSKRRELIKHRLHRLTL